MGLFSSKKEGGVMDMIRCDEQDYLIWKWRPKGNEVNTTNKENAIRWGSSLRVKDGEVAVFVYKQKDGVIQDFIEGPYDEILKTANLPIISNIIGLAYNAGTPFQAEVYFINLAGNNQIRFGVPYFDVYDPRFLDFAVPMAARGSITFNVTDYKSFVKLHRMINFNMEDFTGQIKDMVTKYIKGYITNLPSEQGIPVLQIERKILEINDLIEPKIKESFINDFGVNLKRFDLSVIEPDKESKGYVELRKVTADQTTKTTIAQTDVNIKNLEEMQAINARNLEESLRIQREELQRNQKLQTETNFMGAHALNQQTEVLKTAADSLGSMGNMDMGGNSSGGMNPAGMMTGMMMGGAMGNQMAGMMNQMGNTMNPQSPQNPQMPPTPPSIQFFVAVNGQQTGPFNMQQLQQLVSNGQLQSNSFVWKQGMQNWEEASKLIELQSLFGAVPPPPPPMNP
jgi:membrane protease subunit (stomatin/prohibitin family)